MPGVKTAEDRIASIVRERFVATGIQLAAFHKGQLVIDHAAGEAIGGVMSTDTVHNCFCLSKYLLSAALMVASRDMKIGPDCDLADFSLPDAFGVLGGVRVLDVINHQAGLRYPNLAEWRCTRRADRDRLLHEGIRRREPGPAYSEVMFGLIIEGVLAAISRRPTEDYLYDLLDSCGAADVAVEPQRAKGLLGRRLLSAPIGGLPAGAYPMLSELLPGQLDDLRPALGVVWSMRAAATFADAFTNRVAEDGGRLPGIGAEFYDPATQGTMQFASGFVVGPGLERFRPCTSETVFGHLGGVAAAVLLSDPENRLSVALYINGVDLATNASTLAQATIVQDVYRSVFG